MARFLAEVSDVNGKEYGIELNAKDIKSCKEYLVNKDYKIAKIVPKLEHHFCKYCGGIAEGSYDDLLCTDCRGMFGHNLYSEL